MLNDFVPLLLMIVLATGLALTLLKAQQFLGPRRPNRIKRSAYESGMDPIGTARQRYSVKFYLVAMIFIIFDIEVVFFYPWAVVFRDMVRESAFILWEMLGFVGLLGLGYVYVWRKGGLDWN